MAHPTPKNTIWGSIETCLFSAFLFRFKRSLSRWGESGVLRFLHFVNDIFWSYKIYAGSENLSRVCLDLELRLRLQQFDEQEMHFLKTFPKTRFSPEVS
jgi:hypothetical protein